MEYKSIDFVGYFSGILSVASMVGTIVLRLGPWAAGPSGETAYMVLTISALAFGMVALMASNVTKILQEQADQIAALQRQIGEHGSQS
jgi:hypothetical protein